MRIWDSTKVTKQKDLRDIKIWGIRQKLWAANRQTNKPKALKVMKEVESLF